MRADHREYTLVEKVDPATTALIVVDMQNDFCHPQGHYGRSGPEGFRDLSTIDPIYGPMLDLISAAREADVLRVFVKSHFDPKYMSGPAAEMRLLSKAYGKACQSNTWGAEIMDDLKPRPSDREIEVIKHRYSAFRDTDLGVILRSAGIKTVVVTGVTTSVCVDSTARDAFASDYFVVIPRDTCADYTEEKHRVFLAQLGTLFGVACPAADVAAIWRDSVASAGMATSAATSH